MKKNIAVSLLALGFTSAAASANPLQDIHFSESPFEACQGVTMISASDFKKNEAFWKQAIGECGANVQVLPETGFFNTMLGKLGENDDARRSTEFLKRVGERASKHIDLNNSLTERLQKCALKDEKWFQEKVANAKSVEERNFYNYRNCGSVLAKVRNALKDIGSKARTERAVMEGTGSAWESFKRGANWLFGRQLAIESAALSDKEKADAQAIIAREEAEVQKDFDNAVKEQMAKLKEIQAKDSFRPLDSPELPTWFKGWYVETGGGQYPDKRTARPYADQILLQFRQKHFAAHQEKFLGYLGELPVLAFLGKSDATDAEIAAAAAEVMKNGQAEKAKIARTLAAENAQEFYVDEFGSRQTAVISNDQEKAKNLFGLMQYGPVVRELLQEDPRSCQTATGIANMIANTELRNMGGLLVGMVGSMGAAAIIGPTALAGAGIAATPMAGGIMAAGVGAGFGAGLYLSDRAEFLAAKQRTFSVVETVDEGKAIADVSDFADARDHLLFATALSPADLIGLGIYSKVAGFGGLTLAKLFQKPGAVRALSEAMKKKGMSDLEIQRVFSDLQSSDANVARAATRKLFRELDIDENQAKFIRLAASKGILIEANQEAVKAVMKEIKDGRVYSQAMKILENVNAAKINAGNRDDALKAAIAGADFGITDPKKLAAVINDWDSGLDGLARTFEVAKAKMASPEIRGIASLKGRQEAAFSKALDELMESSEDFRRLPASEKQAAKEQMMTCGVRGL